MDNSLNYNSTDSSGVRLDDDYELLNLMIKDSKVQDSLYTPGPYWAKTAQNAESEIRKSGISKFRGSSSLIGLSYSDNLFIEILHSYNHGLKNIARKIMEMFPFNRIHAAQVNWTRAYANESIIYVQEILKLSEKTEKLLELYNIPYSILGNCLRKATIKGQTYSTHYLSLLEQHDNISSRINFNKAHAIMEIGGGFGTNIHLMLENYKNIKKVLYLDIAPNLYVGTQYLKAFYGSAVRDYSSLKELNSIEFSADDSLEIYCITPWQIEKFRSKIDIFINSHSFVEMPGDVVQNYVDKFNNLPGAEDAAIALTTYDGFDTSTTLDPTLLPLFFKSREFENFEVSTLVQSTRKNIYYVSPGRMAISV